MQIVKRNDRQTHQKDGAEKIDAGDVILIAPHEKFAWIGHMDVFIANAPRFDPAQYQETP